MKKILFILSFLICAIISFGQYPINQSLGGDSTLVTSKGGFKGRVINFQFNDTTQANTQRISQYPASQIVTKAGQFYIRDSSATKWILLGSGFSPFPTCGLQSGTGIVSYDDSTLNFDVSAAIYALCCDNIPRTSPFTHVTLDSNDADDPRLDAIVLTDEGVAVLKGTPDPNPAVPELSNCEILLTTVLINAGDNVPAGIDLSNLYDEGVGTAGGEWDTASTGTHFDFVDTNHPVHLTHDIAVSPYLSTVSNKITLSAASTIQLTNYSVFTMYILLANTPSRTAAFLNLRWNLSGGRASDNLIISNGKYGFDVTQYGIYQKITIPIQDFGIINPNVNQLVISLSGSNAYGFYIDWIQLQSGISPPPPSVPSVQSIAVTGNDIITPNVINPTGTNTTIQLPFASIIPHGVLYNPQDISAQPVVDTFDVSVVKGLLPVINIAPGSENQILQIVSGVPTWQDAALPASDTIAVISPIRVNLSGDPSIPDTLYLTNIPVTLLNSGTGATSSTFWRGDGTWASPLPYKIYTALISQSGTDDPVVTVLQNTIGSVVWTRSDVGVYTGTLSGSLGTQDKNWSIIGNNTDVGNEFRIGWDSNSTVVITTFNMGVITDGELNFTSIEIRVYP